MWSFLDVAEGFVLASFRHATGRPCRACTPSAAVRKRLKPVQWAPDGYITRFPVAHTDERVVMDARLCAGHPPCVRTGAPVTAVLPLLRAGLPIDRVGAKSGWGRDDVESAVLYMEGLS